MTYPILEEEKNPKENPKTNPYTLFLILILLILSNDALQILKIITLKRKTKKENKTLINKKREQRILPAD
ncbi:MAG: hypothetical protein ACOC1O_02025 [bacterium]